MKHAVKFWGGLCVCLFLIVPQGAWGAEITVVTEDWKPYNFQEGIKSSDFPQKLLRRFSKKRISHLRLSCFPGRGHIKWL